MKRTRVKREEMRWEGRLICVSQDCSDDNYTRLRLVSAVSSNAHANKPCSSAGCAEEDSTHKRKARNTAEALKQDWRSLLKKMHQWQPMIKVKYSFSLSFSVLLFGSNDLFWFIFRFALHLFSLAFSHKLTTAQSPCFLHIVFFPFSFPPSPFFCQSRLPEASSHNGHLNSLSTFSESLMGLFSGPEISSLIRWAFLTGHKNKRRAAFLKRSRSRQGPHVLHH